MDWWCPKVGNGMNFVNVSCSNLACSLGYMNTQLLHLQQRYEKGNLWNLLHTETCSYFKLRINIPYGYIIFCYTVSYSNIFGKTQVTISLLATMRCPLYYQKGSGITKGSAENVLADIKPLCAEHSEGTKTYIYIICHTSTLTWHR